MICPPLSEQLRPLGAVCTPCPSLPIPAPPPGHVPFPRPFQKPLEESRSPFNTTSGGFFFLQLFGVDFPFSASPFPTPPAGPVSTGNRSRKEPVATQGGMNPIQSFPFGSFRAASYLCLHIYLLLSLHPLLQRKCILFHIY